MQLIVGLGNAEPKHTWNRHNVGFMIVDGIAQCFNLASYRNQFAGLTTHGDINGERVIILKPTTFMNESGRSVGQAQRFFKLSLEQIVVVHDDIDLEPGKIRVKKGGGPGGHNGLKSIDSHIGLNYRRIRIGVGRPSDKQMVSNFVLSDFERDDRSWLETTISAVVEAMPIILDGDNAGFTNKVGLLRDAGPSRSRSGVSGKVSD